GLDDALVDARVASQYVKDAARPLEQPRQLREQLADRMRLVGAEVGAGALDARPVARPGLGLAIARLDEERERRPPVLAQDERGVRVVEARQVVEVAVLAEAEVRVARARREPRSEQDRDRLRLHRLQESLAAGGEHEAGQHTAPGRARSAASPATARRRNARRQCKLSRQSTISKKTPSTPAVGDCAADSWASATRPSCRILWRPARAPFVRGHPRSS